MTEPQEKRNPLFDIIKALMMLWVIWGHLGRYGIVDGADTSTWMLNAKIGVNMPIFFVICGYFAASTFCKSSWEKIVARTIGFMWPQIVFALIFALGVLVLTGDGFGRTFNFAMGFWFLHTMAVVYIVCALIFKFGRSDFPRWIGFCVFYGILLFWPSRFPVPWMGQVIHMLPYFVFGLMILRKHEVWRGRIMPILCTIGFILVVCLEGDSTYNGMNFWKVNAHWRIVLFHVRDFVTFFARSAVGIAGSVSMLFIIDRLMKWMPRLSSLAVFGTTTLGVYVMHEFILLKAGSAFSIPPFPSWTRWIIAVMYFFVCHCVVVILRSNAYSKIVFFGDERRLSELFNMLHIGTQRR